MKLDPNSREELPAALRVAAQLMAGLYVQADGTAHSLAGTAMLGAHTLIAAYNDGQDDEPSAKMPTREEMVRRFTAYAARIGIVPTVSNPKMMIDYLLDGEAR